MKFARICIALAAIMAVGSFSRPVSRQLPAALDRYLTALPAMSLIPFAPLYLGSFPLRSTVTSRLYRPCRVLTAECSFRTPV
jgi:hypothetical protein